MQVDAAVDSPLAPSDDAFGQVWGRNRKASQIDLPCPADEVLCDLWFGQAKFHPNIQRPRSRRPDSRPSDFNVRERKSAKGRIDPALGRKAAEVPSVPSLTEGLNEPAARE